MKAPRSLQARLGLSIGALLTLLWLGAATATDFLLRDEMNEVFDSALQETAQRILPLAVVDIVGREEDGVTQHLAAAGAHEEYFTYVVRDELGRVLLHSHAAQLETFPPFTGVGFDSTPTHRLYSDAALQGTIRITVAEPLSHRAAVAQEIQMVLGLPILIVIPAALLAIILATRASLAPLRRFRSQLEARDARDLSPVPWHDLPSEAAPVAATLNQLLDRLKAAFDAERSFAANAAHELRTPLAGAIAQAQRLQAETPDAAAKRRASDIEATLKRLTRLSERLMQLARAEGGRLRLDAPSDLRMALRIVVEDMQRMAPAGRVTLSLPQRAAMSDLDPDVLGIVARNLIENALRHGDPAAPVAVTLTEEGALIVANDGPAAAPDVLARLTGRFERANAQATGSGLGLAIVAAIAERVDGRLSLISPRPGHDSGFEARFTLPHAARTG